jgi:choline dehydrogenase
MHDYVIVGAGTAGCVLAARLTENPATSVLLLEAGPVDRHFSISIPAAFSRLFKTRFDWNFSSVPQPALEGRSIYFPRGRMLGGTSSMNAMLHVRGNPADYDGWREDGCPGWGWDDVLPAFRKAERHARGPSPWRGTDGPLEIRDLGEHSPATHAFVEAAQEAGLPRNPDMNGERQEGVDYSQVTQRRGRRWSVADAYLRPALKRPNLTVRTDAQVRRILLDGSRATGAEYAVNGATHSASARREVILAAGAIGSPHLLMLSGIGDGEQLRTHGIDVLRHSPEVGANLQDHLACGAIVRCPRPVTLYTAQSLPNVIRYLLLRKGPLASNVAEALAFFRSDESEGVPDLELVFAPSEFRDHGLTPPGGHGLTLGTVLLTPRSSGAVRLRSPRAQEAPEIDPRYLSDPDGSDLARLTMGMSMVRRVLQSPALSPFVGEAVMPDVGVWEDEQAMHSFIRERSDTLYHPCGTCRMGTDEAAVADPHLRVRGVENLRVIDASVMPRIIRGHTNSPTVMIAERGAEMLR